MAKRASSTIPEANDPGEQGIIFAELDDSTEHKAVRKAAKLWRGLVLKRKEYENELKEKEDGARGDLISAIKSAQLPRFEYEGEIFELQEKDVIKIKKAKPKDGGDEGDDA